MWASRPTTAIYIQNILGIIPGGIKIKTYNDVYIEARKRLREEGIEAYDIEARLIAVLASGKTREQFVRDQRLYVPDDSFEKAVESMILRRLGGEPIAYVVGEWEFYGLPLQVSEEVLIPRVDTEVVADTAIKILRQKPGRVLDLCTGSGCIGLAIAANVPDCRVVLADKSVGAIRICRANMLKNNLSRNVTCIEVDAEQNPPMLLGRFDMIVCNPPYIPSSEIPSLDASVRDYEPFLALDGGEDGLDYYRCITSKWKSVLKDGGHLIYECGAGQAKSVAEIMTANSFADIAEIKDTLGIDRVVTGTKKKQGG
jgi:release factor glutamine methyltransferase